MNALDFAPAAERDLEDISGYIAQDKPRAATNLLRALLAKCELAAEMPTLFPLTEEHGLGIRRAVHRPYLIFYRIVEGGIRIERVIHGAQLIPDDM